MNKKTEEEKINELFLDAVEKYDQLLKLKMDPELLNASAMTIVESCPESMQKSLMLKFTFMLGYNIGLTRDQIYNELKK